MPESALDISEITEVLTRMQGTLSVLSAGADSLSALQELAPALAGLQDGISAMSEAGNTLSNGIDTLSTYLGSDRNRSGRIKQRRLLSDNSRQCARRRLLLSVRWCEILL